jgi:uncharacterized protein YndB with AHSA1/START domain
MRDGTVEIRCHRAAVRFERALPGPPAEVWRALTDRHQLASWFPSDVIVDAWVVGAAIDFRFPGHRGMTMTGTVLEVEEPRLLVYTWGEETLRFELHLSAGSGNVSSSSTSSTVSSRRATPPVGSCASSA